MEIKKLKNIFFHSVINNFFQILYFIETRIQFLCHIIIKQKFQKNMKTTNNKKHIQESL